MSKPLEPKKHRTSFNIPQPPAGHCIGRFLGVETITNGPYLCNVCEHIGSEKCPLVNCEYCGYLVCMECKRMLKYGNLPLTGMHKRMESDDEDEGENEKENKKDKPEKGEKKEKK